MLRRCSLVRSGALLKLQGVPMRPGSPVTPMCVAESRAPRPGRTVVKVNQTMIQLSDHATL